MVKMFGGFLAIGAVTLFIGTFYPVTPIENWLMSQGFTDAASVAIEWLAIAGMAIGAVTLLRRPSKE